MTDLGDLHAASVLEIEDGTARLAIKGTEGSASVDVPEDMVAPLKDTIEELDLVYGDGSQEGALIG